MNMTFIAQTINRGRRLVGKNLPEILTVIGIGGMIATTVLSSKATVKAVRLIEEEKDRRVHEAGKVISSDDYEKARTLRPVEVVKVVWKVYIPTVTTGILSIACLIGATSENVKRKAALAAAYKLSETAFLDYKGKVRELLGEKKATEVQEKISQDKVAANPIQNTQVIVTGKGDSLCLDLASGRYFKSNIDWIKKVLNELNRKMLSEMYISLNEFYMSIGLEPTTTGDELGWNIDNGFIDIKFGATLAADGTPCITLEYDLAPEYDYAKFM